MDMWIVSEARVLPSHTRRYQAVKRLMDLTLCISALPLLVVIGLACALAILIESGRPVFFIQNRIGRGGRVFPMYKFRSMWPTVDDSDHRRFMRAFVNGQISHNGTGRKVFKPFQPSQVTRVGRFLRKTSLDELPQIINVFKGEMSLIGPRPNVPWEVAEYRLWHHERLEVLPGITGLAQVRGRSGLTFNTIVQHDLEYVANASLQLDLKILYWTARSIFLAEGAV
jgi:lipopolysaccharide/colanic/teichoic acid biosynthesis glycosyltransferase